MQTMTSASCDADVAELSGLRRRTRPGKDIYITSVTVRKSAAGKPPRSVTSLTGHSPSVREDLGEGDWAARLRADLPPNIAGRAHAPGGFTDPGQSAPAAGRLAR